MLFISLRYFAIGIYNLVWSRPNTRDREARKRALQHHLERQGIQNPVVDIAAVGTAKVSWPISYAPVSIIIPTKDNLPCLKRCLTLIESSKYPHYEIILVDNGSQDTATWEYYRQLESSELRIKIVPFNEAFNYSRAINFGVSQAQFDIFLFLNNDVERYTTDDWLEELVRWVQLPDIGVVSTKLLYPDHTIQHAGVVLGMSGAANHIFMDAPADYSGAFGHVDWYRNYSAVTGACQMVRREVFELVGGYDEAYELVYSDIVFCKQIVDAGYRVLYTPFATLIHHEGKSRGRNTPENDKKLGATQFHDWVDKGDPYFNPNLAVIWCVPALKQPNQRTSLDLLATS